MAGYDNIKEHSFNKMSAERQREIASMGGKAAQRAAKRRKTMREIFQQIGELDVADKTLKERLVKLGVPEGDITWNVAVVISTYVNAVKKNDVKTVALLLKMLESEDKKKKNNEFDEFMKEVE